MLIIDNFERILMKIAAVQLIFLLLSQLVLHRYEFLPELKGITKYEGVEGKTYTEILETFQGK
jgi:Family of unknown function (DUF5359)